MSSPVVRMVARLKALSSVTAIVGARIWPMTAPQGYALPLIVYRRVDRVPISYSGGTTSSNYTRVQVDLFANTYDGAQALADAVRGDESETSPSGLSGWVDADGRVWHLEMEQDDIEPMLGGRDEAIAYRVIQDYVA